MFTSHLARRACLPNFKIANGMLGCQGIRTHAAFASPSFAELPNAAPELPKYTLVTLRSFPSLEPHAAIAAPAALLAQPIRRDLLWRAVVFENDRRRVGASNPPGRSTNGYSRKKLLPQKGSGRARVGDANSPTRHNGARALARNAPNKYATELPNKIYATALANALSSQYRQGNLMIIGQHQEESTAALPDGESYRLDLPQMEDDNGIKPHRLLFRKFLDVQGLDRKRLLFVTSGTNHALLDATVGYKERVDVVPAAAVEVNDILKARKIFMELEALKQLHDNIYSDL